MKRLLLIFAVLLPCVAFAQNNYDWANFGRYTKANQPEYFTDNNLAYLCNKISTLLCIY